MPTVTNSVAIEFVELISSVVDTCHSHNVRGCQKRLNEAYWRFAGANRFDGDLKAEMKALIDEISAQIDQVHDLHPLDATGLAKFKEICGVLTALLSNLCTSIQPKSLAPSPSFLRHRDSLRTAG